MKWGVVAMVLLTNLAPPVAADPVTGCEGDPVQYVLCLIENVDPFGWCYGIAGAPKGTPVAQLLGADKFAEEVENILYAGIIIANGGNGAVDPGGHSSFVFVGAISDPGACMVEIPSGEMASLIVSVMTYWLIPQL